MGHIRSGSEPKVTSCADALVSAPLCTLCHCVKKVKRVNCASVTAFWTQGEGLSLLWQREMFALCIPVGFSSIAQGEGCMLCGNICSTAPDELIWDRLTAHGPPSPTRYEKVKAFSELSTPDSGN